jgi:biopolymer transport protein ExbB
MGETGVIHFLRTGDAVTHAVAWLLLAMSIASWCFLLVKGWMLTRARRQAPRAVAAFWQAPTLRDGVSAMRSKDAERVFTPLAEAALHSLEADVPGALLQRVERGDRVMRSLRHALQRSQRRLEFGQVLLASIGSTAPFVGLLGTVWGIYHALGSIASSGQASIDSVAGPVGETLIMTAFGLVVAIPAVIAYNILGRLVRQLGEDLDGFARDLHAFACAPSDAVAVKGVATGTTGIAAAAGTAGAGEAAPSLARAASVRSEI